MTERTQHDHQELELDERAWRASRVAAVVAAVLCLAGGAGSPAVRSPLLLLAWLVATPPLVLVSMVVVEQLVLRRPSLSWATGREGSAAPSPRSAARGARAR